MGVLLQREDRGEEAEPFFVEAIRLRPSYSEAFNQLGLSHQSRGNPEAALENFREAARLNPGDAAAQNNLGVSLLNRGEQDAAAGCFREAVRLKPGFDLAHKNLGLALKELGRSDDAARSLEEAIRLNPDSAEARNVLGNVLQEKGELDAAIGMFRKAIAVDPGYAAAHSNFGNVLLKKGKIEEAVEKFHEALRIDPEYAVAHNNLGNALRIQGKLEEAVNSFQKALQLDPDDSLVHRNLGIVRLIERDLEEGVKCFEESLRLSPDSFETYNHLAQARKDLGQYEEALGCYKESLRLRPADGTQIQKTLVLPVICRSREEILQLRNQLEDDLDALLERGVRIADPMGEVGSTCFYLAYHGMNDREIQRKISRLFASQYENLCGRSGSGGKVKVGFVSAYFMNHTIGKYVRGIVRHMSRDAFEVTVVSVGDQNDEIGGEIKRYADAYAVVPDNFTAAREIISSLNLDVLFYTDIGMDALTYFLPFTRIAPVQCTTWGHPDTTGIETVDYFISSRDYETENADAHYTEELVRLENNWACYSRLDFPGIRKGKADFGMPEKGRVYLCPQSLFKFHPDFDEIIGNILRSDPAGELFLVEGLYSRWNDLLMKRFHDTIPDVADRIRFAPRMGNYEFMNWMALADALLDPVHFSGGVTSYEALSLGVPIVTLPGEFMRSRTTYGIYKKMGVTDCIARNPGEYVELALKLGTDPDFQGAVKAKILEANHLIFDDLEGVRELERFFLQAVEKARAASG